MKKLLLIFVLFTNSFCFSQIINIPDVSFKALLLQSSSTNLIAGGVKVDANDDGEIEQSEALLVYTFLFPPGNISNLTGIEYFTNLTEIVCYSNLITSANFTTLTHIEGLNISGNQLTSLNLTGLTNLSFINCGNNQLAQIDFSSLTALRIVICNDNSFTVLDFTNNPQFDQLACTFCPNLTTIKIKNNRQQIFTQTPYNGCWDDNPNLTTICADDNEVSALQTFLYDCGITQPINIVTNCALDNENFVSINFAVLPNPTSETVFFDNSITNFTSARVYNCLGQEVLSKKLDSVFNENLNMSMFVKGIYIVKFYKETESISLKIVKE